MTPQAVAQALTDCRDRIDDLDRRILSLLNERTEIVERIGRIKSEANLPVYEPRREDAVFQNVSQSNRGPLAPDAAKRIFERIIDEMRQLQRRKMARESQKDESCL